MRRFSRKDLAGPSCNQEALEPQSHLDRPGTSLSGTAQGDSFGRHEMPEPSFLRDLELLEHCGQEEDAVQEEEQQEPDGFQGPC